MPTIAALTPEQKRSVVHHLQSAVRARAMQWDHTREIERILDTEIDDDTISNLAVEVETAAESIDPRDLAFINADSLADCFA